MSVAVVHTESFAGTSRFEIVRRLSKGGIGTVYEALDRARNHRIALKALHRLNAAELVRFKNEFRLLQGIHHPNLVRLGELFEDAGQWFFTMELVEGQNFLSYVRDADRQSGAARYDEDRLRESLRQLADGLNALHLAGRVHGDIKSENVMVSDGRVVLLDFGLVSEAHPWHRIELERGVIMGTPAYVAPELIQGKAATAASDWYAVGVMLYQALTGTFPFRGRSREIVRAKLQGEAPPPSARLRHLDARWEIPADLEALCVQLLAREPASRPSSSSVLARLSGRSTASVVVASMAQASAELTSALVGRTAEVSQLRRAFARAQSGECAVALVRGVAGIGKSAIIDDVARDIRDCGHALVLRGRCFEHETVPYKALDGVVDALTGYAKDILLADDHPDSGLLREVLAGEVAVLARLFPVIGLAFADMFPAPEAVAPHGEHGGAHAGERSGDSGAGRGAGSRASGGAFHRSAVDLQGLRRRAFAAFRRVLAVLARRRPLAIIVEDLHWSDRDSAALLAYLISTPWSASVLLLISYRSELSARAPVSTFIRSARRAMSDGGIFRLDVKPLSVPQCRQLAMSVWHQIEGQDGGSGSIRSAERIPGARRFRSQIGELLGSEHRVEALAYAATRESDGNPLLIVEMMRYLATANVLGAADSELLPESGLTLDALFSARRQRLDPHARQLLDVIALAGRPVPARVALRAAGLEHGGMAVLSGLCADHFVRSSGDEEQRNIELYHERIRSVVLGSLDKDGQAEIRSALIAALERWGCEDAEILIAHHQFAGRDERAAECALMAAEQAEHALAFERAAELYTVAAELNPGNPARRGELLLRRGYALAQAGHGLHAARAYLTAADAVAASTAVRAPGTKPARARYGWSKSSVHTIDTAEVMILECKRRAAEQYLRGGSIDSGVALLEEVLQALHMQTPRTEWGAMAALLTRRLKLSLRGARGWRFQARANITEDERLRADVCWSAAVGLAAVDHVRAADFAAQGLLFALDHGDRVGVAVNLALEACYSVTRGHKLLPQAREYADLARQIAIETGDGRALAYTAFAPGAIALYAGEWQRALSHFDSAMNTVHERRSGLLWEEAMIRMHECAALWYHGAWGRLKTVVSRAVSEAEYMGDRYAAAGLAPSLSLACLGAGDVEAARAALAASDVGWTTHGYHLNNYMRLVSHVHIDLYTGDAASAWRRLGEELTELGRSVLMRSQWVRMESAYLRGRCALAALAHGAADRRASLAEATRMAKRIEQGQLPWSHPLAGLLRAGVAATTGDIERAERALSRAGKEFDNSNMTLLAAVARRQRAQLVGAANAMHAAERVMGELGIREPAQIAQMLAPGVVSPA